MKFGLMFFASSEEALSGNKYRLVMDSARFADANGFSSVWVPERHFTEFGSLYPNPAVLHAAIAACTSRVRLHAGSVVVPLHHPMRIAEEWAMVDNLSNGRVGVSFAPGWNPDDFAFCPEKYASRQDEMFAGIKTVQHLWRGGTVEASSGNGNPIRVRIYPTPLQPELPVWLTAAGNPKTFTRAGEMGANLLTHLLDQNDEQLQRKIALYREARAKNGWDPKSATVTVMLHTFVGSDAALVREQARDPFCNYIRSNIGLLNGLAQSRGQQVDVRSMPARELDEFVRFLYERFAQSRGLIGTPESCLALVKRLEAIGVDEVACLLDFGPPVDLILQNLPHLLRLQELHRASHGVPEIRFDPAVVRARCTDPISGAEFDAEMQKFGIQIEGAFQGIVRIWRRDGEALGEIVLPESADASKYAVHPAFLDACSRVMAAAIDRNSLDGEGLYLPAGVGAVQVHNRPAGPEAWSHAVLRDSATKGRFEGDVRIYDPAGRLLIEIEGLRLQRMNSGAQPAAKREDFGQVFYRRTWKRMDPVTSGETAAREERVLHFCSGDSAFDAAGVLETVKALVPGESRLWLITSGAMPVIDGEAPAIAQSPIWGLGRAIAVEHPAIWGGLIDLDPADLLSHEAILRAIQSAGPEDMIALRGGQRYVARIERDDREPVRFVPVRFVKDGTYLITGGAGGLGRRLASWLLAEGAGRIAVMGRSPAPAVPAGVRYFRGDVSQASDVAGVIDAIGREMPPLKGVFHLAGALDDALLAEQNAERFHRAGAAKIEGAWNLHHLTADLPLEQFVLFSSMASLVTMPGQGNYAAANSYLDALAHLRRAQGKPALSINWGPWAEIGHAATEYGKRAHEGLAAMGIDPLAPDFALGALKALLERGAVQTGVARVNWRKLFEADPAATASPLLSEFLQFEAKPAAQETLLVAELRSRGAAYRQDFTVGVLSKMLAEVLRLPGPGSVAPNRSLFELGLDSILALELTSRISSSFGRPFRATLFFTHPTVDALADHILREVSAGWQDAASPVSDGELSEDELSELIAQEIGRA